MTAIDVDAFIEQWREWHEARERDLAAPHGWLAITRLEWLSQAPQRFPGIPGEWHHDGEAAYATVEPREEIDIAGHARYELGATAAGVFIDAGETQLEVAHRGGGYILRVHDPQSPVRQAFRGVPAYEPDVGWVLDARFEPFDEPRPVTVGAVAEGLQHVYTSPGVVVFERDGTEHRLTAFNGKTTGLSILFTDETSGVTTYAANRSLAVGAPRVDEVTLDFTRAVNLPCAFIDFATCPLPPAGNHLPFEVLAGERTPYERTNRPPMGAA